LSASTPMRAISATDTAHLAGRVGRLMLANGADTEHAGRRIDEVACLLGHPVRRLIATENILLSAADGGTLHTRVGPSIGAITVDMARLGAIERVLQQLREGRLDATEIDPLLDAIEDERSGYPVPLVIAGVAVTAGALARLFGADWPVLAAALAAGAIGTALRFALARRRINPVTAAFAIALVSGVVAGSLMRLAAGHSPVLCLTAAGMILVPGVPLLNGVRDLIDGHAANGVARLAIGGATIVAIAFALFLAAGFTGGRLPVDTAPGMLPVPEDMVFAAAAAIGYAASFNVPLRKLWVAAACGIASHSLRTVLVGPGVGADIATGSLAGAFAAGLVSRVAGHHYHAPAVTFAIPGIVTMFPGSYGFRAAIGALHLMDLSDRASPALVAETVSLALTTVITTVAIAVGLMIAFSAPVPSFDPHFEETD
jgi:uncharacterized membrane protein YjjP (DUF1212 family)